MWSFGHSASSSEERVSSTLLSRWLSSVSALRDKICALTDDSRCILWDDSYGLFPLTDLMSKVEVISLDAASCIEQIIQRIAQTSKSLQLVIVVGGPLLEWEKILQQVLSTLSPKKVVVFTTEPREQVQMGEPFDSYKYYVDIFASWANLQTNDVVIIKNPIVYAPLAEDVFILPSQRNFNPQFVDTDATIDIDALPLHEKKRYQSLADAIVALGTTLQCKLEVWALGANSTAVAHAVNQSSAMANLDVEAKYKAALILIDRILDLASPNTRGHECLADRYFVIADTLEAMNSDNTPQHTTTTLHTPPPMIKLASAPLPQLRKQADLLSVLMQRPRIAHAELRKRLNSVAREANTTTDSVEEANRKGGIEAVRSLVRTILEGSGVDGVMSEVEVRESLKALYEHIHVFTASYVASQLSDDTVGVYDGMSIADFALVKHLLATQNLQYLLDALSSDWDVEKPMSIRTVLSLTTLALSLHDSSPEDSWKLTSAVRNYIATRLLSGSESPAQHKWLSAELREELETSLAKGTLSEHDEKRIRLWLEDEVDNILKKLTSLGELRSPLQDYRNLVVDGKYVPLVTQVADHVFNKTTELRDLKQVTFSMSGLLKTGISKFGFSMAKPRPTDRKLVIIFVVGGITCAEINDLRSVVNKQNVDVLIASNCIATPHSIQAMLT